MLCKKIYPLLLQKIVCTVAVSFLPVGFPRFRGEYTIDTPFLLLLIGSPPHPRGIQPVTELTSLDDGIIPASAGNTLVLSCALAGLRDHPRFRGEYPSFLDAPLRHVGSPPHPRGIPSKKGREVGQLSITPASAGNTIFRHFFSRRKENHPRIRGKY